MATETLPSSLTGATEQSQNATLQSDMPASKPAEPLNQGLPPVVPGGEASAVAGGAAFGGQSPADPGTQRASFLRQKAAESYEKQVGQSSAVEGVRQQLAAQQKHASSFWPKFLATAAALKGDFRPAMQLQQQKLQTDIAIGTMPYLDKIRQLSREGRLDEAREIADMVAVNAGDRAPEIAKFYNEASKAMDAKRQQLKNTQDVYKYLKSSVKDQPPQIKKLRDAELSFLENMVAQNSPVDDKTLRDIMRDAPFETQIIGGSAFTRNRMTGQVVQTPTQRILREEDMSNPVLAEMAQSLGKTPQEVVNSVNKVLTNQTADPEDHRAFAAYRNVAGKLAAHGYMLHLPQEPAIVSQAIAQGGPAYAATGGYAGRPGDLSAMQEAEAKRTQMIAFNQGLGADRAAQEKPGYARAQGYELIDTSPEGMGNSLDAQGILYPQGVEAIRQGAQMAYVPLESAQRFKDLAQARRDLQGLTLLWQAYQDPNTVFDRVKSGVGRFITDWTGIPTEPGTTVGRVYEALATRSLEKLRKTEKIDDARIGTLKTLIAQPGRAERQQALDAMRVLDTAVQDEMDQIMGRRLPAQPALTPGQQQSYPPQLLRPGQVPGQGAPPSRLPPGQAAPPVPAQPRTGGQARPGMTGQDIQRSKDFNRWMEEGKRKRYIWGGEEVDPSQAPPQPGAPAPAPGVPLADTVTVRRESGYHVIPLIIGGKKVSADEAISHATRTGQWGSPYPTQKEAESAWGRTSARPAKTPPQGGTQPPPKGKPTWRFTD